MTVETECRHCGRRIVFDPADGWIDPEATGDDVVWRETCDSHDTFEARHEPVNRVVELARREANRRDLIEREIADKL